jgi:hypothetical protein
VVERKKSYYGVFSSFMGSYHVTVPKGKCEIINEDLDCYYSGLPSPKAYDMENKQPFEFNNDTNVGFTDPFADKPLNVGGQTKTSIDFLYIELSKFIHGKSEYKDANDILTKSKSMYDDELMDKYDEGYDNGFDDATD